MVEIDNSLVQSKFNLSCIVDTVISSFAKSRYRRYLIERSFKERQDSLVGSSHCDQRVSSFVAFGDLVFDIITCE